MILQIELPEPIEAAFRVRATRRGQSAEQLVREFIQREVQEELQNGPFDDLLGILEGRLPPVAQFYSERRADTAREDKVA